MSQVLTLPEPPTILTVRRRGKERFSDAEYWTICEANPDLRIERSPNGEIILMPPAGGESDYRTTVVSRELSLWSRKDGRGKAFGPSVQYFLPDGSGRSPDASWVSNQNLGRLSKQARKKFLKLVPEFVIEVLSPSDVPKEAKAKMEQWIANGVELGWLIDGDARTIQIYRHDRTPRLRRNASSISGEGSVAGFTLNLNEIWQGL